MWTTIAHAGQPFARVRRIAHALHTATQAIHGRPYPDVPDGNTIESLRTAVRRYDLAEPDPSPRPLPQLRADVARVAVLRREARCGQLAPLLPDILRELTAAVHQPDPRSASATPISPRRSPTGSAGARTTQRTRSWTPSPPGPAPARSKQPGTTTSA